MDLPFAEALFHQWDRVTFLNEDSDMHYVTASTSGTNKVFLYRSDSLTVFEVFYNSDTLDSFEDLEYLLIAFSIMNLNLN